jgi:hypothetical protein
VRVGKEAAEVSEMGGQRTRLSMLSRSHSNKNKFKKKTLLVTVTRTERAIVSATWREEMKFAQFVLRM